MRVVAWLCEASPFYQYASIPHPGGRGQSWRYPGKGRTRENKPTRQLFLQVLPMCWTVGTSPRGVGQTGRGQRAPSPVSAFNMLASPTPPGLRPPPPPRWRGQSWRYPGKGRIRESEPTRWLFLQVLPIPWTVGTSPRGVGQTGRGQKAPSPVSTFNMPASSTPGRGSAGDTRGKAVPGAYPRTLDRGGYTPVGVGQTGREQTPPAPVSTFNMPASSTPGRGSAGDTRGVSLYTGPWEAYSCGGGAKALSRCLYFQYVGSRSIRSAS